MFNPKIKDFLEKNPEKTLLGFYWAMYWRWTIIILPVSFLLAILISLIK